MSQIVSFNFLPPTVSSLNFKSIPTHNKNLNILLNPSKDLQREVTIYIYYGDNILKQLIKIDKLSFQEKEHHIF